MIKEESIEQSILSIQDADDDEENKQANLTNDHDYDTFGKPAQSFDEAIEQDNKQSHTVFLGAGQNIDNSVDSGRVSQGRHS